MVNNNATGFEAVMDSPIPGVPSLGLRMLHGSLSGIEFLYRKHPRSVTSATEAVVDELYAYFCGNSAQKTLSFQAGGTPFQQLVWRALCGIPYGTVCSYGELARRLGSSARAVAGACRANPIPLLIPCHRVVAARGYGGYLGRTGGQALTIKRWLLQHEGYL